MKEWKYIKTIDDLPTEDGEYIVVFRHTAEEHEFGCNDFVTTADFEWDQKLWRLSDNWYINPLVTLNNQNCKVRYISHWMEQPDMPEE